MASCPQLPTITQLALEIAGLENAPPQVVRFENGIPPTVAVYAVNPPAGFPFTQSNVTPLAFISPPPGAGVVAQVTQPDDPNANSFFYAATDGAAGLPPTTLFLVYDYPPLTSPNFTKGQLVAQFSIPLVVLNNGIESEAPTTIEIFGASGCGKIVPCVSAAAVGSFGTVKATDLGLNVTLTFGPSANSKVPHAIFGVQAKLLVTKSTDPAYFPTDPAYSIMGPAPNPLHFDLTAFTNDELGSTPKFLGLPVGIAPLAAPQCQGGSCTTPPQPSSFPFCASIEGQPAVAAFYSIGTVGTTYVSAPLVPPQGVTCPF
jgi:hypothetical protein